MTDELANRDNALRKLKLTLTGGGHHPSLNNNYMKNIHQSNHHIKIVKNNLQVNTTADGETLEQQIERMVSNKEPMDVPNDPLMYTERQEGVLAATNIRTDRFEIAVEAHDKIHASYSARREEGQRKKEEEVKKLEPIQAPGAETPKAS